jgi:PAS domain S-box-containing protein
VTGHDAITDLLRQEEAERTRVMLNATPLACTFWDENAKLLDCNQEALSLFGVSSKEEFIRRFYEFSPAPLSVAEYLREALRSGRTVFEWTHRTAGGDLLPAEVILVRVAWRDGFRVVGYTRDLRKIKATEARMQEAHDRSRELEVQKRAAQAASEAKSKFLASMSHEIRTPMNAIIGMIDLMRTDNLDETQMSFLTDIKKMSHALLQIINDILDFSKIEVGKLDLVPVHFSLFELYENICSVSRFATGSKDLEFRHSFDPRMPAVVYGDDIRIRQVITNLVNNAVKYTKEGYVDFAIRRLDAGGEDSFAIVVKDTGIGIKEEDFPKLFGSFQQLDSAANHGIAGSGLGLAITKQLVSMMRGRISFQSVYGEGSEFTVRLPLVPGDPGKVERRELKSRVLVSPDVRVLVVDDNYINLKVALAFLALHNIHGEPAENGAEALEKIRRKPYDLVFMDHMMPEMDGVETVKRIRRLEQPWAAAMPIIALSANAVSGAKETFLAAGMNDFISKPIDAGELNRKLVRWLPADKIAGVADPAAGKPAPADQDLVINRALGIGRMGGDAVLYEQLVKTFQEDHREDAVKIQEALDRGDHDSALRIAHTLKSAAAFIGALRLQALAGALEKALRENRPAAGMKLLPELGGEFRSLLQALNGGGGHAGRSPQTPAAGAIPRQDRDGSGPAENRKRALGLLETLIPLLRSGNTRSLEYLPDIEALLGEAGEGESSSSLEKQLEDFEFQHALETAMAMQGRLLAEAVE